jgi:SAM-dependent methyltransferase
MQVQNSAEPAGGSATLLAQWLRGAQEPPVPARHEYRRRIYAGYLDANPDAVAPQSLACFVPRAPYLKRLVREHFPADRSTAVLDLGCGAGALIHVARELGYRHLSGVDTSAEQVAAAARLGIVGVTHGDLFQSLRARPDASEDVIVAFDVIEHFDRDELVAFVDHVYRALHSGGRFIVHTPNAESPLFGRIRYGDLTHELAFTRNSLTQLLRSCGFAQVECYEDRPVIHGPLSAMRAVLWRLFRALVSCLTLVETGASNRRAILSQNLLAVALK